MLLELRYSSLLLLFLNNDVFIFDELYDLWHAEFVCGGAESTLRRPRLELQLCRFLIQRRGPDRLLRVSVFMCANGDRIGHVFFLYFLNLYY